MKALILWCPNEKSGIWIDTKYNVREKRSPMNNAQEHHGGISYHEYFVVTKFK